MFGMFNLRPGGGMTADQKAALNAVKSPLAYSMGDLSGAITLNVANGDFQHGTAVGAITWTFSGASASGTVTAFTLELVNGGSHTQTWPISVKWDGGIAPQLATVGVSVLTFYTRDGGTTWRGFVPAKDSK